MRATVIVTADGGAARHVHRSCAGVIEAPGPRAWLMACSESVLHGSAMTGLFGNDGLKFSGPLALLVSADLSDRLTQIHSVIFNIILVLIWLHLVAIGFYFLVKGENLVVGLSQFMQSLECNSSRIPGPILAGDNPTHLGFHQRRQIPTLLGRLDRLRHPLGFRVANLEPDLGVYATYYYYPAPLHFSRFLRPALKVENQVELGFSIGSASPFQLLSLSRSMKRRE